MSVLIPFGDLTKGWQNRADPSKIDKGAAFEMRNCQITDRDGISPRPGTQLFGAADSAGTACVSAGRHRNRAGDETAIRSSSTILEYFNTETLAWETLKTGFTTGLDFDFEDHNINTDALDYTYFGNGIEPYQRWSGWHSKITSARVGGETSIPVTSTLTDVVYYSGTASAVTTTTLDVANTPWGTNIWNNFYVRITSGANQGQVSLISATTSSQITFTALAGLAGTPTFEIRKLAVSATGFLVYGGVRIQYSAVPTDASFTVASANAAAINSAIAMSPEEIVIASAPRGNRLLVQNTRMFVANVTGNGPSLYYSKIADASSFTFGSPRIATDGGIIDMPEGGGTIKDIVRQEDVIYALKNGIVKTVTFTQDGTDLPEIKTLLESNEVSIAGKAFKVDNDVYFATAQNALTSIGRLPYIDTQPRSFDFSFPVKKGISGMDFSNFRGGAFNDRAFGSCKETSDSTSNDVSIVHNYKRKVWEGIWDLDAADFFEYSGGFYYVSAVAKETYKMFEGFDKEKAGVHYPINAFWKSGYLNYTKSGFHQQKLNRIMVSGWIATDTTLTFDLTYDFGNSGTAYSWDFQGTETTYVFGEPVTNVLGVFPLGVEPLAMTVSDEVVDGKRKFLVFFNVPNTQHNWFQLGFGSNGIGQNWEIIDIALDIEETEEINLNLVKNTET